MKPYTVSTAESQPIPLIKEFANQRKRDQYELPPYKARYPSPHISPKEPKMTPFMDQQQEIVLYSLSIVHDLFMPFMCLLCRILK